MGFANHSCEPVKTISVSEAGFKNSYVVQCVMQSGIAEYSGAYMTSYARFCVAKNCVIADCPLSHLS